MKDAEGVAKGEIRRSHHVLVMLGRERFGRPGAKIEATLTAVQDLDRLDRMTKAILTAKSWADLLAIK